MANKISQEIIDKIPILYEELGNKTKVAATLGISTTSVTKYLNLANITSCAAGPSGEKKKRTVVTEELVEQINSIYAETINMVEVARRLGISNTTVKKYLSKENIELSKKQYDDRDALFFYIYRLFGENTPEQPVSAWNLIQMTRFKNNGISYRAQLLTLKYFYEVEGNSAKKSKGSIGIIPFKFPEARAYYMKMANKQEEINEAIQRQLEKDRIEIKYNPSDYIGKKKKKKLIDLNSL